MLTTAPCISEEQHHASWCCHKEAANTHKSHKATMEIYFPLALPPLGSTWGGINLSACLFAALHYIICWKSPRAVKSRSVCSSWLDQPKPSWNKKTCPHARSFKVIFYPYLFSESNCVSMEGRTESAGWKSAVSERDLEQEPIDGNVLVKYCVLPQGSPCQLGICTHFKMALKINLCFRTCFTFSFCFFLLQK